MELFDAHCHLDDEKFKDDLDETLKRMKESGVTRCVCVGSDLASSARCLCLAAREPGVYCACGVHPHEAEKAPKDYLEQIALMLNEKKAVAMGEIGLDYFYGFSPRETQKRVLLEQLDLASMLSKPVIFHIRDAHGDMLALLKERRKLPRAVVHCFSGSAEVAKEYLKMGFYISFTGPLTFKKAPNLRAAAECIPLDRLMVETDSPYLAPEPMRGRRNEPAFVRYVLEKLAQIKQVSPETMAEITTNNAREFYGV